MDMCPAWFGESRSQEWPPVPGCDHAQRVACSLQAIKHTFVNVVALCAIELKPTDRDPPDQLTPSRKSFPRIRRIAINRTLQLINTEFGRVVVKVRQERAIKVVPTVIPLYYDHSRDIIELTVDYRQPSVLAHLTRPDGGTGLGTCCPKGQAPGPRHMLTCFSFNAPERVSFGADSTVPPPARISPAVVELIVPCGTPEAVSLNALEYSAVAPQHVSAPLLRTLKLPSFPAPHGNGDRGRHAAT